jgi:hypothetical protein
MAAEMHWNATDKRYHEALRRIAVVLIVLAGFAERASQRSTPVRALFLWLLRRAEKRTSSLAVRIGAGLSFTSDYSICVHDSSGEAARLARTFRALADFFFALSRQSRRWLRVGRPIDAALLRGNFLNAIAFGAPVFVSRRSYADTS